MLNLIIGMAFFVLLVGLVLGVLGYDVQVITIPDAAGGQSWWQRIPIIGDLLEADIWVANIAATFIMLITFQIPEIPKEITTLILVPLGLGMFFIIASLVRGTSST